MDSNTGLPTNPGLTDVLGRELAVGDVVIGGVGEYDRPGVVMGFTATRVKVGRYHEFHTVAITDRHAHKLLILRDERFQGTKWGDELALVLNHLPL